MEFLSNPSGFPKVIQNISKHLSTHELKSLSAVSSDWSHAIKEVLEERAYFNLNCTESAKSIDRTYQKFVLSKVNRMYIKKAMKLLVKYNNIQCEKSKSYKCEELLLRKLKFTNSGLKLLATLKHLNSLDIDSCCIPLDFDEIDFNLQLENFTITSDDSVNEHFINRILISNKNTLKTIQLMFPFDDQGGIFEHTIFPQLQKLSLLSSTVSADALEKFFEHHKSLQNLTIMNAVGMQDSTLDSLSRNCVNLKVLDLRFPLNTTERSVDYINRLHELRVLNIHGLVLEGREISRIHLPKLTAFGCGVLRETSNSIAEKDFESLFYSMPVIRSLNMAHCENRGTRITSKVISLMSKCLPELIHLKLNGNYYLCDGKIQQIDVFKNLEFLNLYNTGIKDKFLCEIKAPRLKTIDIGLCDNVSMTGLMHIVEHFRNIESIEMTSCKGINDSAIRLLLNELNYLKFIDVRDCPVSLDGIKFILSNSFVNAYLSYEGDIGTLLQTCGATGFIFITKHDKSILKVSNRCREIFIYIK
ncbi:hypothetical protein ACFFRR_001392 [Megaselia abdita]